MARNAICERDTALESAIEGHDSPPPPPSTKYKLIKNIIFLQKMPSVREILVLVNAKYRAKNDTANPILLKFKNENENFKILNFLADRKFAAIQQNHQNSI
jgi:hypothetical protein